MSEQPDTTNLPDWDVADRMRKSLRHAGISVQEMADYLDVDRSTVSTWINGRIFPASQTARLWALRTGVPYAWLCHGTAQPCIYDANPQVRRRTNNMQSSQTKIVAA